MRSQPENEKSLLARWSESEHPETLMKEVFGEGGLLAEAMPGFEYRSEQVMMAEAVARALSRGEKLIVEAGTGTGKSLAYLVPLILWATSTGNRAVISTGTKTLQHQLMEKDLPLIREKLGLKFNASLCLGAENYLCARRFRAWAGGKDSYAGGKISRTKVLQWAKRTKTGIKAEIDAHPAIWREICRNSDLCPLTLCNQEPDCHYNKARRQWQRSNLLIVNHYLFFANVVARGSVLPDYGAVLFDEAHQVEEVASNYLGYEVSNTGLDRYLNALHNVKAAHGLYYQLSYLQPELRDELKQRVAELRSRAKTLFDAIAEKYPGSSERKRMRQPPQRDPITLEAMRELVGTMKRVKREAGEDDKIEVDAALRNAEEIQTAMECILLQKRADAVYWLEIDRSAGRLKPEMELIEQPAQKRAPRVSLNMAPLSIADDLDRTVYRKTGPVAFVSATLSVAGDLAYSCERLGLDQARKVLLPHSFDYARRVMLYVDRLSPDPSQGKRHEEHLIEQLDRLLPLVTGGTFVLFTSYRMLDSVFFELKRRWEMRGANAPPILLLRHGQAPREELLDQFRDHGRAALFGTATFWQGIDVPGKALECVVIVKLPFAVPDEPIVEARVEDLREKGRNPFYEYQVPQAVMMFRQGFGRLMRKKDDRGVVALFDPRIYSKPYGRLFIESIPDCQVADDLEQVQIFFEREM